MKKLLNDFRIYALKQKALILIISFAVLAADLIIWFGGSINGSEETVKTIAGMSWLFTAIMIVSGFFFVCGMLIVLVIDPKRLRTHLENLPSADREQLISDYENAGKPENGRFFLSKFMLYFTFGGGIMRYAIIDRISIYPNGLWIESVSRSVLLKTGKTENKEALLNKLIERTNKEREQDE